MYYHYHSEDPCTKKLRWEVFIFLLRCRIGLVLNPFTLSHVEELTHVSRILHFTLRCTKQRQKKHSVPFATFAIRPFWNLPSSISLKLWTLWDALTTTPLLLSESKPSLPMKEYKKLYKHECYIFCAFGS